MQDQYEYWAAEQERLDHDGAIARMVADIVADAADVLSDTGERRREFRDAEVA